MKLCWGSLVIALLITIVPTTVRTARSGISQSSRHTRLDRRVNVQNTAAARPLDPPAKAFLDTYCITCHNQRLKSGGLMLDTMDLTNVAAHAREWEKVVVKLRAGLMPPSGMPRPDASVIDGFSSSLEAALDSAGEAHPNPGRTEPFHRLNRAEYRNAVRDLLALDVDVQTMLPHDEVSYGFDNIAGVLKLSPLLTERYLSTAQKIARLALGTPAPPNGELFRLSEQFDQDVRLPGMPVGTRGGTQVNYYASRNGDYVFKARLARGVDYDIPHFLGEQNLEISVDGEPVKVFTLPATPGVALNIERQIYPPPGTQPAAGARRNSEQPTPGGGAILSGEERNHLDDNWVVHVPMKAGFHDVRATFLSKTNAVSEGFRRPFLRPYFGRGDDDIRETREGAALQSLEIMGPLDAGGAETSESFRRVFICRPAKPSEETPCAKTILTKLARRAYRRAPTDEDVKVLMTFYTDGRKTGDFDHGIEIALQRILVSPSFLFRTEFAPASGAGVRNGIYPVSGTELASRLSFFLWSSIPDEELLDLAIAGKLRQPGVLEGQARRMLADPRAAAFTRNFAGQWLNLRKLPDIKPDPFLFPDHGDALSLAFEREAELFFESIVRENRPTLELLTANYTFVNERLAAHYGIPNVKGVNFQRVALADDSPRRGLLGKGAVLSITAFPNRTSPVVRGKWVLDQLLGAPPPEPPPNVPALMENGERVTKVLTMRQRVEQHRANAVCASCHKLMDPIGFALEKFDAIGRYREFDENFEPIDSSGVYPDGTRIDGPVGLRQVLVNHSTRFYTNVTNKLLTYALGRGVEYYDAPAVRGILREAAPTDYRFASIILGIVKSAPFQMRRIES
jgi:hypothetical protein